MQINDTTQVKNGWIKNNAFHNLMLLAKKNNALVLFAPLKGPDGLLKGLANGENRVAIRMDMDFDNYIYNLAHELAHLYLHYDKGNMVESDRHDEYEEQADRAARMLIDVLSMQEGEEKCM